MTRQGKKELILPAIKIMARSAVGKGEKGLLSVTLGSELPLGSEKDKRKSENIIKGMSKAKKQTIVATVVNMSGLEEGRGTLQRQLEEGPHLWRDGRY